MLPLPCDPAAVGTLAGGQARPLFSSIRVESVVCRKLLVSLCPHFPFPFPVPHGGPSGSGPVPPPRLLGCVWGPFRMGQPPILPGTIILATAPQSSPPGAPGTLAQGPTLSAEPQALPAGPSPKSLSCCWGHWSRYLCGGLWGLVPKALASLSGVLPPEGRTGGQMSCPHVPSILQTGPLSLGTPYRQRTPSRALGGPEAVPLLCHPQTMGSVSLLAAGCRLPHTWHWCFLEPDPGQHGLPSPRLPVSWVLPAVALGVSHTGGSQWCCPGWPLRRGPARVMVPSDQGGL